MYIVSGDLVTSGTRHLGTSTPLLTILLHHGIRALWHCCETRHPGTSTPLLTILLHHDIRAL